MPEETKLQPGWLTRQFSELQRPYTMVEFARLNTEYGPYPSIPRLMATVESQSELERLAREVDECYRLMGKIPADQPNLGVRGLLTLQKALSAQSDHFAEQDKGKTE